MFLLVDKPKGVTSHDVVERIRKITGEKKVGHGGALDPNATGLLVIAVGRKYTKQLGNVLKGFYKTYEAEIILGEERDTHDVEGEVVKKYKVEKPPLRKTVNKTLETFVGAQEQTPPIYSAVKIGGKSAHKIARKGGKPKLEPKSVAIKKIEFVDYQYPVLKLRMTVSPGTYIRSFARDIGRILKTGAFLGNLRRTKTGSMSVTSATPLSSLDKDNWQSFGKASMSA